MDNDKIFACLTSKLKKFRKTEYHFTNVLRYHIINAEEQKLAPGIGYYTFARWNGIEMREAESNDPEYQLMIFKYGIQRRLPIHCTSFKDLLNSPNFPAEHVVVAIYEGYLDFFVPAGGAWGHEPYVKGRNPILALSFSPDTQKRHLAIWPHPKLEIWDYVVKNYFFPADIHNISINQLLDQVIFFFTEYKKFLHSKGLH